MNAEDSRKHSLIYNALIELHRLSQHLIIEEEYKMIKAELDRHIKMEREMNNNVSKLIDQTKEVAELFLLEGILRDEKMYHNLLLRLKETVIKREVRLDAEGWEKIWRKDLYRR